MERMQKESFMKLNEIEGFLQLCEWHREKAERIFEGNHGVQIPVMELQGFGVSCELVFDFDPLTVQFLDNEVTFKTFEVVKNNK